MNISATTASATAASTMTTQPFWLLTVVSSTHRMGSRSDSSGKWGKFGAGPAFHPQHYEDVVHGGFHTAQIGVCMLLLS